MLRDFWKRLHRRRRRDQGPARRRGARRAQRDARRRTSSRRAPTAATRASARTAATGRLSLKIGKFGAFIGCSNYPECRYTRQLADAGDERRRRRRASARQRSRDRPGGDAAHRPLRPLRPARRGRRQEREAEARRPAQGHRRRPPSISSRRSSSCRCRARSGCIRRPASRSWPASAASARIVLHDGNYANLEPGDDVFAVGLNRAVTLLAEKSRARAAAADAAAATGRTLGEHPTCGGKVTVHERPLRALRQRTARSTPRCPRDLRSRSRHAGGGRRADRRARRGARRASRRRRRKRRRRRRRSHGARSRAKSAKKKPDAKEAA